MFGNRPGLGGCIGKMGARKLRQDAGCSCPAELAYPWVDLAFGLERGSFGDKVIDGASKLERFKKTRAWG